MPEPYAQVGSVTLYCADSFEMLCDGFPGLDRAVVVTDPLYNIGYDFGPTVNDARAPEVYEAESRAWFNLCMQSARALAFTPGMLNLSMWYAIKQPTWQLGWFKPNASGRSPWGRSHWEPVLVYGEVTPSGKDDVVIAPIDYEDPRIMWHPCPKPYAWAQGILERLVESEFDRIVDFFVGSGTVLVQSLRMGLSAVGCELQERYCERIALLLEEELANGPVCD
jgi:hypothetical protein